MCPGRDIRVRVLCPARAQCAISMAISNLAFLKSSADEQLAYRAVPVDSCFVHRVPQSHERLHPAPQREDGPGQLPRVSPLLLAGRDEAPFDQVQVLVVVSLEDLPELGVPCRLMEYSALSWSNCSINRGSSLSAASARALCHQAPLLV